MISAKEAIFMGRCYLGTSYEEMDCINLIKKVIRTSAGGDKSYTTAGTNDLWNSDAKSGKYRDLTAKQEGIAGAKPGMLAFMGVGTGDVNHVGLVTECGTVLHSSKSRGCVVETELTAKAGWNGLGTHRMIAVGEMSGDADDQSADEEQTEESAEGGIVTVFARGGLRMRKNPRGRYMQMIPDGTQLVVLEEKGGWLRVEYRGYTGWISGEYCCKAGED